MMGNANSNANKALVDQNISHDADDYEQLLQSIATADRLLIVAAAGLSISEHLPNNPYHDPKSFAHHYPQVAKYGYRTTYETMGMGNEVPMEVRRPFTARHFLNMRYDFPPTEGYSWLLELAKTFNKEDTFCWTSNVDGCFERSGFDRNRVYTTQGEMKYFQCADALGCGHVWECEQQMRDVVAAAPDGILNDLSVAKFTKCPKCGGETRPNLRGGDWFNHRPYETTGRRLLAWMDEAVEKKLSVAVLEVGVGPNTPVVTSIPAAAFASALAANGGKATFLRVNPDTPHRDRSQGLPGDGVKYYRMQASWSALKPVLEQAVEARNEGALTPQAKRHESPPRKVDPRQVGAWQKRYTDILVSLRTPR